MLVVEARDIGRGRLLAVEPDVLDRCLTGPEAIFKVAVWTCDSAVVLLCKSAKNMGQQIEEERTGQCLTRAMSVASV